jgi:outer membrane protein assembly factor BamE (lipoprotein component of BamABCDE complex)
VKTACLIASLAILCLPACSTPGSQYAAAHPDLSPTHRRILVTGEIPGGNAVEGMTKEQIRIAAGNPTSFEKVGGQDVWVYVRQKSLETSPANDPANIYGSGPNQQRNFTETALIGPQPEIVEAKGVFFKGDRATYTQIRQQRK